MTTQAAASPEVDMVARQRKLLARYRDVRSLTNRIIESLEPEDCVIQSMPDVSPTRWHLAHTTWFFETFVLKPTPGFRPYNERFEYLFNSYYNAIGQPFPRSQRGLLSRPKLGEVLEYRHYVDERMDHRMDAKAALTNSELDIIELGLNHEQQHQELMLTDIKHVFSRNPLAPAYRQDPLVVAHEVDTSLTTIEASRPSTAAGSLGGDRSPAVRLDVDAQGNGWHEFEGGLYEIGSSREEFAFDNESPRHRVWVNSFELRARLVSVGEYLDFMSDGGYQRPELWLSLGWQHIQSDGWNAPLYWQRLGDGWREFTLCGLIELNPRLPVCHLSYFEADAFARWAGARLPTEAEWETASWLSPTEGNFADVLLGSGAAIHPSNRTIGAAPLCQMFGDVWEWTSSSYAPYPGYELPTGALGEYNSKFMCNQYVLRGGSCATPSDHIRRTYRNFFPPEARWQFSGIRLARSRQP